MPQTKNDLTLKRLKSKYAIEHLFTEGKVLGTKHLIFRITKQEEASAFYAAVSVSKRNFKSNNFFQSCQKWQQKAAYILFRALCSFKSCSPGT